MKLELKNVTKKYDLDTLGVEDITFSVQDGIFGIAGEAGSGMMTILGVTGGWLDADAGEIIFDGKVMNDVEPRQRNCLLICGGKMPLWGSVERNLTYGLKKRGISGKEATERADLAAEKLGIKSLLRKGARTLTPFEAIKANIARLAARGAAVALFYDPYKGLTYEQKLAAHDALTRVVGELGCAAVMTVPDGRDLALTGTYGAVIRNGRVLRSGRVADILDDPRTAYVAEFTSPVPVNIISEGENTYAVRADQMALTSGGYAVVSSGNGYTALETGRGEPPVIVCGETAEKTAGYEIVSRTVLYDESIRQRGN